MSFGSRLAEERKRLGLKQADFAALVGTDVPKQSLYENDRRELRAEYLAKLVEAEVDVVYILSGRRNGAGALGDGASALLSAYLALPASLQRSLEDFVGALRDHTRGSGAN
jgi:transcriptional regulator with XRE-family HTH domain